MKDLVKNTVKIGGTEVALILVGIAKNKYLAVEVGPEGYGMYSLLDSFFGLFLIFSGSWLSVPTMKYIAELRSKEQTESIQSILNFSFTLALLICLFFVSVFLFLMNI